VTFLVERLKELRRYVDHLHRIRSRVRAPDDLATDLSLHNDVVHSLLMVAQLVIDIAGELSARNGLQFEDYTTAVRNLSRLGNFPAELVERLALLPGFRNVIVHEYVALDLSRAVSALNELDPLDDFIRIAAAIPDL
jgi:uncharacterized protein YutE (UPF0331/DUF86 family)